MEVENVVSESEESSDSDESLCEHEVEEEGCREIVLIPKESDTACSVAQQQEREGMNEDATEIFLSVLSVTMQEQLIRRSPRGQIVGQLLEFIQHLAPSYLESITALITCELNRCLLAGKRHKLPSVAQGAVWSAFHTLRFRTDILKAWMAFIKSNVPAALHQELQLALQIVLDRLMKKLIKSNAEAVSSEVVDYVRPLTVYESNAVRYMAGYVAVKLLKKYRRGSKNPAVRLKYQFFTKVLQRMKAEEQLGEPDSPLEYSTLWMEVIDRGGLYHINDDVFNLIEMIEIAVRRNFNFDNMESYIPGTDLRKSVRDHVQSFHGILTCWETISEDIPRKYENYSVELLSIITDLWISIRGHSFAKGWNIKFEKKYKQGTRKTLAEKKQP